MTTPDDNASFLARFAIVAQIGIIVFQLFMVFYGDIKYYKEANFILLAIPAVSHLAIACIYFLFHGGSKLDKNKGEDAAVCWFIVLVGLSLIGPRWLWEKNLGS